MLGYACITCLWTLWTTDFPCSTKGKSGQSLQRHFYCAWLQMKAKCPNVILQSPNRAGYYQKHGGKKNLGVCRQGTYRECPLQALTVCTSELWKRVHNYYSVWICDKLMLKFRWGKKHKMPVYLDSFDHLSALIFHSSKYFLPFLLPLFLCFIQNDRGKRTLDTWRQASRRKKNSFPGVIQLFLLLRPVRQVSEESYK